MHDYGRRGCNQLPHWRDSFSVLSVELLPLLNSTDTHTDKIQRRSPVFHPFWTICWQLFSILQNMNAFAFLCVCVCANERDGVISVWLWSEETWWMRVERELKSLLHLFYHMDKGNREDGLAFRFLRASIKTSFELLTCSLRRLKLPSISFSIAEYSFSLKSSGMYPSVLSPLAPSLMSKKKENSPWLF